MASEPDLEKIADESGVLIDKINAILAGEPMETVVLALATICAMLMSSFDKRDRAARAANFNTLIKTMVERHDKAASRVAGEDFKVILAPQAEDAMAGDSAKAEFVRDVTAQIRQALDGVDPYDLDDVDRRMRSMGAKQVDLDDEDIPKEVREAMEKRKKMQ